MALRPDIALQTQGIKLPDFAGAYESMLNNRARREAMDQNRQLHQAQMQEYQRKTAAEKAAAESAAQFQSGVAAGASDDELMAIDAAATLKLREAKAKAIKDEAEAKLKTLEVQAKNAERGVGIVSRISDNNTLMAVLDEVDADPDLSKAVPQQIRQKLRAEGYTLENRQLIRQFRASVLSEKDRIDDERADAQLALAKQAEQRQQDELLMKKQKQPLEVAKLENEVEGGKVNPQTGMTRKDEKELDFKQQTQQALETYRANSLKISQQNANRIAASQGRAASQNQVTNEAKLRDDFSAAAKPFKAVSEAFTRVMAADGDKGVNDIALIYGYMKMLDPGSVVREGEFATAANAAGIPDRITTLYNNAIKGAKLSPQIRQEMKEQAKQVYQAAEADFASVEGEYRSIAERSGVDPRNVIVNFRSKKATDAPKGGGKQLDKETAMKFFQQSGGDKEKAREAARRAGYTF